MYWTIKSGWTIASDLKISEGAAILHTALKQRRILCASGRDSQVVPICFQIKATALQIDRFISYLFGERELAHSLHTQDVDSSIGEIKHLPSHRVEHPRVRIIEVPLIMIKRRPDPPPIFQLDETPGMVVREDLPGRLFVLVRHGPIGKDPVKLFVRLFSCARSFGPLVVPGGMVEDKV